MGNEQPAQVICGFDTGGSETACSRRTFDERRGSVILSIKPLWHKQLVKRLLIAKKHKHCVIPEFIWYGSGTRAYISFFGGEEYTIEPPVLVVPGKSLHVKLRVRNPIKRIVFCTVGELVGAGAAALYLASKA